MKNAINITFNFSSSPTIFFLLILQVESFKHAKIENINFLADLFRNNANMNSFSSSGNRFSVPLMQVAVYLYIRGGRSLYEFLKLNLVLPSYETLRKQMSLFQKKRIEGKFYFDDLIQHIQTNAYPNEVAIVEDGTKLTESIEYDADSNSILGLVLPIDESTGMPRVNCFPAETAKHICDAIKNFAKSSYVQVVLAKPNLAGNYSECLISKNVQLEFF